MAVLRGSVGFLLFFSAFSFKTDLFALGVIAVVSGVGGFIGVIAAPVLRKSFREEVIVASSLVLPAVFAVLGALLGGGAGFALTAMALAIGAAGGRLGFDSLLQRDGPDAVRGRAFARFETRFQLVWVIGGLIGVIPFPPEVGLFLLAIVLGFAAISYVAALRAARSRASRTKLLPEAVDRAIVRSRDRAFGEVRSRFRRQRSKPDDHPDAAAGLTSAARTGRAASQSGRSMRASQRPGASSSAGVGSIASRSQTRFRPSAPARSTTPRQNASPSS